VFRPYRFALRLATAALLGLLLARNGVSRRTLGTVVASLLLTYSEDALSLVNSHGSVRLLLRRAGLLRGGGEGDGGADGKPLPRPPALVRWAFEVRGMRCQACAARVRGAAAGLPGVVNATAALEARRVEVWADTAGPATAEGVAGAIRALDASYAVSLQAPPECFDDAGGEVACGASGGGGGGGGGGGAALGGGRSGSGGEIEMADLSPQGSGGAACGGACGGGSDGGSVGEACDGGSGSGGGEL
jgi:copper chaperone CopZ